MVTVVTMMPRGVGAFLKRPSPSSQPSQGAEPEVKGACGWRLPRGNTT